MSTPTRGARKAGAPTDAILRLPGGAALGPARLAKKLRAIRAHNPGVVELDAQLVHFVALAGRLDDEETATLQHLLRYGPTLERHDVNGPGDVRRLLVVPRLGTISPWSSKATDIAHICGLAPVRRIERGIAYTDRGRGRATKPALRRALHDRMTESVLDAMPRRPTQLFARAAAAAARGAIALGATARAALERANRELGLALARDEIDYLLRRFRDARPRSDRRRADDVRAGQLASTAATRSSTPTFVDRRRARRRESLFADDPAHAPRRSPRGVLSAYNDNAAVIEGAARRALLPRPATRRLPRARASRSHILMKVETHNHPTAISPFPGAATGSGGEIRDEGATGRGAQAQGRPHRLLGVEPAHARRCRSRGSTSYGKPDAHRLGARHHARRPARRRGVQQRVRPAEPAAATSAASSSRRSGRRARGARLPQADHARGRPRQHPRASTCRRATIPAGAPLIVLGGPGDADRPRRRRGVVDGVGRVARGSRFRVGAARQRRDAAPLPGGDRSLLGAGRATTRSCRSTTSARAACRTRCPSWCTTAARRALRAARDPERRAGHVAAGDLVQRGAGALRARRSRPSACAAFEALCARERCPFAVVGDAHRRRPAAWSRTALLRRQRRSTCRSTVLLGKPPQDDARRAQRARCVEPRRALDARRAIDAARGGAARAAPADGRRQDLPDHHRRSHASAAWSRATRWSARGRCRSPTPRVTADRLRRLRRRGDGDGRAHAARAARRGRVGAHGGRRGDHQHRRGADRARSARRASCRRTGWRAAGHPGEDARALRRGARGGRRALPGAGHRDPGRQGLDVDAHGRGSESGEQRSVDRAAVADRLARSRR